MNKEDAEKRNEEIIEDAKNGMSIKAIADKYKLSRGHIYLITKGIQRNKTKRIEFFSNRVKEKGLDGIREWAEENNISDQLLSFYLRKLGYKPPRKKTIKRRAYTGRYLKMSRVYNVIAALQNGATPCDEDAKRLGVTRQYISQVRLLCESAGVKIKIK